jgi:hypothetical protein
MVEDVVDNFTVLLKEKKGQNFRSSAPNPATETAWPSADQMVQLEVYSLKAGGS